MRKVAVQTESKSYDVWIEAGCLHKLLPMLKSWKKQPTSIFIITDSTVAELYLDRVKNQLKDHYPLVEAVVPAGEASKSFVEFEQLLTVALENGLDRDSMIIALGGGVVGDIAGFVAATYMRGIRFVQIPTTLLAHDSSVGGKVAINHRLGKNMIGAFHQPEMVIYDPELLVSLPEQEWRSGFAEAFKHGLIQVPEFYQWLQEKIDSFVDLDVSLLEQLLERSIAVKAEIVAEDEKEAGVRAHLNLGHTLGHAIETQLGYGKMTHGEAVALGIIFAMRLSEQLYQVKLPINEFKQWLRQLGYDTNLPKTLQAESLLATMKKDKKVNAGIIRMVLMKEVGSVQVEEVDEKEILTLIEKMLGE
ncbi:3-dehydroquinate synthase [Alkalihalobacillus alcalophilus ATCC 27647 = CGMCC 1.3604]|uniref:3-dehydroquinate synthase n=1 Tax=Alkalihalobacillus alcalophilus ATCC 27647 = CGMCC 1.3604 TaxID=1218173 RepID=A0A094YZZ5_ALKAL|nr:3-dehydroquinate synthase [Alkalihalobacillus alcalophilus]KGA99142.1 3-dehydroquinate synthase [Alkalihalobacillus alcalophilus ATCC 27647 = CGMCC 1.3604]MED1560489.1 3-dehydroquinate synthase [Alkalihalobacillus alcalophilus]THG92028.1 3-dehydroquinate synthase [Alkalihalobacillus alcalophilus ATCC 27647 = CGMCC 1.3604]